MHQFIGGFIVGLSVVLAGVVWLMRKKSNTMSKTQQSSASLQNEIQPDRDRHVQELEELAKLTGQLAHEIKNPLSTIKVNLNLVREELASSDLTELAKTAPNGNEQRFKRALRKTTVIQKEMDRLERILDSFLRYVTRTELQLAETDINELVSDMVDFYSPQAQSHSIVIRQGLHKEPLICKVDPGKLKQVILNLFINAQQSMGSAGELIIRTDRQNKDAVIQISDTGNGIAPDKLDSIFDAYYSTRPQGSGLGLPTAKKIVEAHNGTIAVASEPSKGTLFTVTLPLFVAGRDRSEV
ncbi:MAG: two-component sensor histidine kinase [Planctomycetes bacterium]|nr:two-component sensor histidine kinase [Planctomycetota bacterium]